jgi:hypothetical protein
MSHISPNGKLILNVLENGAKSKRLKRVWIYVFEL